MVALISGLTFFYMDCWTASNMIMSAEAQCKGQPGAFEKTNLSSEKSIIFVDLTRFCPNFRG